MSLRSRGEGRLYGLDLIRTLAFLAILIFHWSWAVWIDPSGPPNPMPTSLGALANTYARAFSFSGFTIVFLSFFLIGYRGSSYRKKNWLPVFFLAGFLLFSLCTFLKERGFPFTWDIYPLLVVGILSSQFFMKQQRGVRWALIFISVLLLSYPVWKLPFTKNIPFLWGEVLFGRCPEDYADWPLIPWIALIWFGALLGQELRLQFAQKLIPMHRWEFVVWIPILVWFFLNRGAYFSTDLGDGWSCFTFRQEPKVFWAHMLFWMLCIRLAFLPQVQGFLSRRSWIRALSHLQVNQNFFLAYLTHYLVIFALIGILDPGRNLEPSQICDWVLVLIWPLTELVSRAVLKLTKRQKQTVQA